MRPPRLGIKYYTVYGIDVILFRIYITSVRAYQSVTIYRGGEDDDGYGDIGTTDGMIEKKNQKL